MLKQNGMIMLSEKELETIIEERTKVKVKELEVRNELLRKAVMQFTTKGIKDNKDIRISKADFLKIYNDALNDMFDNPDTEDNDIYGYDITVHWHGIYCNCGDGAIPSNYIIPAIQNCYDEDDEEYTED